MPAYHPIPTAQPDLTAPNQVQLVTDSTPSGASQGLGGFIIDTVIHLVKNVVSRIPKLRRGVLVGVYASPVMYWGSLDLRICEVNWAW